ncbi:MAG: hypothetical protein HOP11_09310 [Saprospiraceae bacterium]|nr:hypothetical protein [Saprospiraceae bacterium]
MLTSLLLQLQEVSASICRFNQDIQKIYSQIIQLRLKEAKEILRKEQNKENNLAYVLMEDYVDFFQLFIYEDETDFKNIFPNKSKRLEKIRSEKIEEQWSLFLQSEILLHWSLIHLKRDENWKAYKCFNEAYEKLSLCKRKFPEFKYTNKSLGILHTLIGTIPEEFEWASSLLGFTGSLTEGKNELNSFIEFSKSENDLFKNEAIAAYSFVISYLDNKKQDGLEYWNKNSKISKNNVLNYFISTKLLMRSGKMKEAAELVQNVTEAEKLKLPYLYYVSGLIKLQNLDAECEKEFLQYLRLFKGNSFVKDSYQKLAWMSLIKGSESSYKQYMEKCKRNSKAITDEDRQAESEAKNSTIPDPVLLKARLLFDGTHYNRAYSLLFKKIEQYYKGERKLEFCYRMGRICQNLSKKIEAISFFDDAISTEPKGNSFMSCYSQYYKAQIKEEYGEKAEACLIYSKLLKQNPDHYSRSLHQKSKAGLIRLSCQLR